MRTYLVGLHDSGKSTALAALWFSVADHSELCEWFLSGNDRPADASHWTALRDLWLSGKPLDRTEHASSPEAMRLKLTRKIDGENLEIIVPDIAGEDFQVLYEIGRFPKSHADVLEKSEHLVLFIHASNYDHPVVLKAPTETSAAEMPKSSTVEWNPDQMHPGSKIIAVLRGIQQLRKGGMPRITVVLTAWDLVKDESTPTEVLQQRFPLLDQYLNTNFDFRLLGISSQGCDYNDPDSMNGVDFDDIKRISVIEENIHNDITRIFS